MKIVVIAQPSLRKELESKNIPAGCEWAWVNSVNSLDPHRDADCFIDLDFIMDPDRIHELSRLLPATVIVNSVVNTIRDIGRPFVRINGWPGFLERKVHELVVLDAGSEKEIRRLYATLGWDFRIIPDIAGMISARILSMIINEAYYTFQEQVSTRPEIDTAMKLGTNYPIGPFEWGERIGLEKIYDLLTELSRTESRYAVADALEKAVS